MDAGKGSRGISGPQVQDARLRRLRVYSSNSRRQGVNRDLHSDDQVANESQNALMIHYTRNDDLLRCVIITTLLEGQKLSSVRNGGFVLVDAGGVFDHIP